MSISPELMPILIVALLTWGGVFLYLLRLQSLTSALEKQLREAESLSSESLSTQWGENA